MAGLDARFGKYSEFIEILFSRRLLIGVCPNAEVEEVVISPGLEGEVVGVDIFLIGATLPVGWCL